MLIETLHEDLVRFRSCGTESDARALLRREVDHEVGAMRALMGRADAFDVIELMRMREFAVTVDPRAAPPDGSPLPVEVAAAIALARSSRRPEQPDSSFQPHLVIDEIHQRAMRLGHLASFRLFHAAEFRATPISRLAAEYAGSNIHIRNMQFDHIRDAHDEALLDSSVTRGLMRDHLGFTFSELMSIRRAVDAISAEKFSGTMAGLLSVMNSANWADTDGVDEKLRTRARNVFESAFVRPGERGSFTASEVAEVAELTHERIEEILGRFTLTFDPSQSAEDRVFQILTGRSPFPSTPLVKDDGGRYTQTSNGIGIDVLRRLLEKSMPENGPEIRRYDKKARQPVSEGLAETYLSRLLQTPPLRAGYSYLDGTERDAHVDLSRTASIGWDAVKQVEGDLLYVVDDVVFAVEVKAKSIAQQAQRGDISRLERELREVLGKGAEQAFRVRRLLTENGGFWETPTQWLDLRHVNEIRTVLVVLDDFGPLGTQLDDLRAADLVIGDQMPLILSLHDLAVISDLCAHPSEFLLYLRRRTDSDVMKYYRAVDELDLFMLFLSGDLFVEDDPDAVSAAHPTVTPATQHERKLRDLSARKRLIGEEGIDLAAWYALGDGAETATVVKPAFSVDASIRALVSELRERGEPGWMRLATRLLDLSGREQRAFARCIRTLRSRTRTDGRYHDAARTYANTRGHAAVFLAIRPETSGQPAALARLRQYATVKQYQLQATESFGLLFDQGGALETAFALERSPVADPNLDAAVIEMGLQPTGATRAPVPPSASRATRQLRGRKKRR